jgi:hypothetical protein
MTKRNATCFFMERTDSAAEYLRRYAPESKCPLPFGYHNASVYIGSGPFYSKYESEGAIDNDFPHEDPNWPTNCECGYEFKDGDVWQHGLDRQYRRSDTGQVIPLRAAPPGAMWDARWWNKKAADGRYLIVKLPTGYDWHMDGPSSDDGKGWKREGTPPNITASPSIWANKGSGPPREWHGHLRGGQLEEC